MDDQQLASARHVFFSVGDHSGDLHGGNLVRALRRRNPALRCVGFGGDHMAEAGCELLFPLCNFSSIGVFQVVKNLSVYLRLFDQATQYMKDHRPDLVVLIDCPGFNWHIARKAKALGIPVVYYVPPQIWAWGRWRVKKMRRLTDHVLSCLPFEESWLRENGVAAHHVGHPYFDELERQQLDPTFLGQQEAKPGFPIALLPGSRTHELRNNTGTLLRAATIIHRQRPDTRFLVACLKPAHAEAVQQIRATLPECRDVPIEICTGRTPEIIRLAHSCLSVSGSVSLELLNRAVPTVTLYRLSHIERFVFRFLLKVKYISLINLLADQLLSPEYVTVNCVANELAAHILHWLNNPAEHRRVAGLMADLRQSVAQPGASERAADYIHQLLSAKSVIRQAA